MLGLPGTVQTQINENPTFYKPLKVNAKFVITSERSTFIQKFN